MKMCRSVLGFFFDHKLGGVAAWAIGIVAFVLAFLVNNQHQRSKGRADAVVTINREAGKLAGKARAARVPAAQPGAVERLRQGYCRDC